METLEAKSASTSLNVTSFKLVLFFSQFFLCKMKFTFRFGLMFNFFVCVIVILLLLCFRSSKSGQRNRHSCFSKYKLIYVTSFSVLVFVLSVFSYPFCNVEYIWCHFVPRRWKEKNNRNVTDTLYFPYSYSIFFQNFFLFIKVFFWRSQIKCSPSLLTLVALVLQASLYGSIHDEDLRLVVFWICHHLVPKSVVTEQNIFNEHSLSTRHHTGSRLYFRI